MSDPEVTLLQSILTKRLKIKYDLACAIKTFTRLVLS